MDIIYNNPWLLPENVAREYLKTYENYLETKGQTKETMTISDSWEPRVVDKTAIIPVTGVIVRYANNINTICGQPTSTGLLHNAIKQYAEDKSISCIILDIDSPGGDARGISDLANTINEVSKKKPVYAVASGMCASAAYWIASACTKIYASEISLIGSIGAVAAYKKDKENNFEEIVSSQSPNKRLDVEKEKDRAIIQSNIDDIASVFISAVGKYRGMTEADVIKAGNKGAVLIAGKALKNKLIDEIGSIDTILTKKEILMTDKKEEIKSSELSSVTSSIDLSEIKGSVSEEMYSKIETMIAQSNANTSLIQEQQAKLEATQKELIKQNFISQAEKKFPNLTGTAEQKGSLLMALENLSEEHKNYVLGLMQQVENQTVKMMETVSSKAVTPNDDFQDKANTKADEIMRDNPGISREKALSLAYQQMDI